MHRVLITGMSGTGKSTVLDALKTPENLTIDLDYDGWILPDSHTEEPMINIDRLLRLFELHEEQNIYLAGCAANQGELRPYLSAIITLTAPLSVMKQRIQDRKDNPFGRTLHEWTQIVRDKKEIEPLLIAGSHYVCNTDRDIRLVVQDILRYLHANSTGL